MATGRLFVVATPIGNLEDIGARALRVLKSVSIVAAEDTRHSMRLLGHYNIHTPLTSYHDHNESQKADELLALLQDGEEIALITDAGTPCIADPGYRIVRAARDAGIPVEAIPGPSAVIAALSVSGMPSDTFAFHGFFPRKAKEAEQLIEKAYAFGGTHIFYESPKRVRDALVFLAEKAPDAEVCVARELTKIHEEVVRGTPESIAARFEDRDVKGECVILVHFAGSSPAVQFTDEQLRAAVEDAMKERSISRSDAVRLVSTQTGVPRNRVYEVAGKA